MKRRGLILFAFGIIFSLVLFFSPINTKASSDDGACYKMDIPGDANADGKIDLSDPIAILQHLFQGAQITCPNQADVNGDKRMDLSDAVFLLNFLFMGGERPVPIDYAPFLFPTFLADSDIVLSSDKPTELPLYQANFKENDVERCEGKAFSLDNPNNPIDLFTFTANSPEYLPWWGEYEFIMDKELFPAGIYNIETRCYDKAGNEGTSTAQITVLPQINPPIEPPPVVEDHFCYSEHKDKCCAKINPATGREVSPPEYVCVKNCAYDKELADAVGDSDMGFLDRWVNGWDYAPNCADYIDENNPSLKEGEWSEASYDKCNDLLNGEGDFYETVDSCAKHSHNPDDGSVICGDKCEQAATFFEWIKQRNLFPDDGEIGIKPMSNEENTKLTNLQMLATAEPEESPPSSSGPTGPSGPGGPPSPFKCRVKDLAIIYGKAPEKIGGEKYEIPWPYINDFKKIAGTTGVLGTGPLDLDVPDTEKFTSILRGKHWVGNAFIVLAVYVGWDGKNEIKNVDAEACREYQFLLGTLETKGLERAVDTFARDAKEVFSTKRLADLQKEDKLPSSKKIGDAYPPTKSYTLGGECRYTDKKIDELLKICCDNHFYIIQSRAKKNYVGIKNEGGTLIGEKEIVTKEFNILTGSSISSSTYKAMFWYDAPQSEANSGSLMRTDRFVIIVEDEDGNHRWMCDFKGLKINIVNGKSVPLPPEGCSCSEWNYVKNVWQKVGGSEHPCY